MGIQSNNGHAVVRLHLPLSHALIGRAAFEHHDNNMYGGAPYRSNHIAEDILQNRRSSSSAYQQAPKTSVDVTNPTGSGTRRFKTKRFSTKIMYAFLVSPPYSQANPIIVIIFSWIIIMSIDVAL
jgi:hypothetical protein